MSALPALVSNGPVPWGAVLTAYIIHPNDILMILPNLHYCPSTLPSSRMVPNQVLYVNMVTHLKWWQPPGVLIPSLMIP